MRLLMDEQMRVFKLRPADVQLIHESEYPLALEFFLQFDGRPHRTMGLFTLTRVPRRCPLVNLFYLKTCSFRFARPRTMSEGLFCAQEPEARYELTACGNCGLCYPQYDRSHRTNKSVVEFSEAHQHTFLNGYRAILNCSAVSPLAPPSLVVLRHFLVVVVVPYPEHHLCIDVSMWKIRIYRCYGA